ncbi:hypothetical protein IQ62_36105 [Streptomyces scabiei]|nr:hypothetical protein IQ62_36105 [Streptomyces scabiei]
MSTRAMPPCWTSIAWGRRTVRQMDLVSAFRLGELERRRVRVRWGLVAQFPAPLKSRGCAPCFSARRPTTLRHHDLAAPRPFGTTAPPPFGTAGPWAFGTAGPWAFRPAGPWAFRPAGPWAFRPAGPDL